MMLSTGNKGFLNFQKANMGKERTDLFFGVEDGESSISTVIQLHGEERCVLNFRWVNSEGLRRTVRAHGCESVPP